MLKDSKTIKEIRKVRDKNYQQTKHMSDIEYIDHVKKGSERFKTLLKKTKKTKKVS